MLAVQHAGERSPRNGIQYAARVLSSIDKILWN